MHRGENWGTVLLKVAVIGFGHLGKWHAQKATSLPNADLVAIIDRDEQAQKNAKVAHPGIQITSELEDVIPKADAFIISSSTNSHFELCSQLILAGKHVFCEKPVCANYIQAQKLLELDRRPGQKIQVGHSERFQACWENEKIKHFFNEHPFKLIVQRLAPWKGRINDVSVIEDVMIHDLDLLQFLIKERPCSLRAAGSKSVTSMYDQVTVDIQYSSGSSVQLIGDRNAKNEVRRADFNSSVFSGVVDLMSFESCFYKDGELLEQQQYQKRDHLLLEHESFYHSIVEDLPEKVTLEEGAYAVYLADQILQSLAEEKPVSLEAPSK